MWHPFIPNTLSSPFQYTFDMWCEIWCVVKVLLFCYHMQLLVLLAELQLGNQNELQSPSNNKQLSATWKFKQSLWQIRHEKNTERKMCHHEYLYCSCFESDGLIQWCKSVIDSWTAITHQSINHMNERYSQCQMLPTCKTLCCILDKLPSCIFFFLFRLND